ALTQPGPTTEARAGRPPRQDDRKRTRRSRPALAQSDVTPTCRLGPLTRLSLGVSSGTLAQPSVQPPGVTSERCVNAQRSAALEIRPRGAAFFVVSECLRRHSRNRLARRLTGWVRGS